MISPGAKIRQNFGKSNRPTPHPIPRALVVVLKFLAQMKNAAFFCIFCLVKLDRGHGVNMGLAQKWLICIVRLA